MTVQMTRNDDKDDDPKMKTLITPLGFDTSQALSFITTEGIGKGDTLIVLRPEEKPEEKRGERAYDELKKTVENFSPGINIERKVLDTQDFEDTLLNISEIIDGSEGETAVNLSGGVRTIVVALTACSVFFNSKVNRTYNYEKIERELNPVKLPSVFFDLPGNEKKILNKLTESGPSYYDELTEALDLSKSTVSRLSKNLEEKNLVTTERVEKKSKVTPTLTGELLKFS